MMETDNLYRFEGSDDASDTNGAPILEVPHRKIVAIEHPCVILNLDKGLATFGQEPDFQKVVVLILIPNIIDKNLVLTYRS